jgi:threonine synthase
MTSSLHHFLECISCRQRYPIDEVRYFCNCGALLAVQREGGPFAAALREKFEKRLSSRKPEDVSGVWRFREAILDLPVHEIITHPEGATRLYFRKELADFAGIEELHFKHEGENPTGSFKDRGMTVAITQAKRLGRRRVACASTGNTSAALAAYAAGAGLEAWVFLPAGKVATGKISQAIGYGARCLAIKGDFDAAMNLVQALADELGLYLVNSLNPFRLEGQKSVMWEMLQDLEWNAPDWVIVPGGNLGNTSAFGKALLEAYAAGWISKLPRLATIQAAGANPFYQSYKNSFRSLTPVIAETVASAIRIGNPVNFEKAKKVIGDLAGVVEEVTEEQILTAKKRIDKSGIGCEPASACSLAGARKLREAGIIKPQERVVAVLTGNILKDPEITMSEAGNALIESEATAAAVRKIIQGS